MPATQITAYSAPCPACNTDAYWQATASNNGDLTRTIVSYDIDCPDCGALPDEAPTEQREPIPMLPRMSWLRRTA